MRNRVREKLKRRAERITFHWHAHSDFSHDQQRVAMRAFFCEVLEPADLEMTAEGSDGEWSGAVTFKSNPRPIGERERSRIEAWFRARPEVNQITVSRSSPVAPRT